MAFSISRLFFQQLINVALNLLPLPFHESYPHRGRVGRISVHYWHVGRGN
jgi:hypothetical protein